MLTVVVCLLLFEFIGCVGIGCGATVLDVVLVVLVAL